MPLGNVEMIETGLGIIEQAATRFGKLTLIARHDRVASVLSLLARGRIATVSPSLPTWAAPPVMLAPVSATGRAMQIGMTSKDHSLIEMSMTAYWTIRARLLRVPGVANVAIWNERLQLMTVQVQPLTAS